MPWLLFWKFTLAYCVCWSLVLVCGSLQALESGKLTRGGVVTEGSARSTAISLATVAPAYGCKCHVVILMMLQSRRYIWNMFSMSRVLWPMTFSYSCYDLQGLHYWLVREFMHHGWFDNGRAYLGITWLLKWIKFLEKWWLCLVSSSTCLNHLLIKKKKHA